MDTYSPTNLCDAAGRQWRPPFHWLQPGRLQTDWYRVLGHRLCQGTVPGRLHEGHRDDALDQQDRQRVLEG